MQKLLNQNVESVGLVRAGRNDHEDSWMLSLIPRLSTNILAWQSIVNNRVMSLF